MRAFSLMVAVLLSACAANPVATAMKASPENKSATVAFALHNSYVVVAEQAATLAENPNTPVEIKRTLVRLHEAASPVAKQLRAAAERYEQVRASLAEGKNTAEQVAIALDELNKLIADAAPKLNALAVEVSHE